jgi:flagellar basal-body rod modification protein FlgD
MSVSPVTSSGAAGGTNAMKQLSSNFDTFLTLLTTQLKNQDPTSPMDSNQFTQQLVQFSQVEQQIDTNNNLKALIAQGQSQAGTAAAVYLGRNVSVVGGPGSLQDGKANWTYTLDGTAGITGLTITDTNNKVVFATTGETTQGSHAFEWDGKDAGGNELPEGAYKLTVTAKDGNGKDIGSSVASAGTVSQIDMTSGTPQLVIGRMEVGVADIAAVAN